MHVAVARSPLAHGVLRAVDLSTAQEAEGVLDAFCADDVAEYLQPLPSSRAVDPELEAYRQPALARGRVRYV